MLDWKTVKNNKFLVHVLIKTKNVHLDVNSIFIEIKRKLISCRTILINVKYKQIINAKILNICKMHNVSYVELIEVFIKFYKVFIKILCTI